MDNQEGVSEKVAFHPNSEALEQTEPGEESPKHGIKEAWQKALDCIQKGGRALWNPRKLLPVVPNEET